MKSQEFQAVVLAGGRGNRLTDLNGDRPKCLLQIASYPLIFYPLSLLQKYGFQDAIVVVLDTQKSEIQQKIDRTPLKLKIDYFTITENDDLGTASTLKLLSERIRTDLLLISCDTITDVDLYPFLNMFRQNNASVCSLFWKSGIEADVVVPGPKSKFKQERDLVGINPKNDRLLFLASTSDFEETMSLPSHLLRSNGRVTIHSGLIDSHIYLMKKWVVDFLAESHGFSTLKGELLPFIIKKQLSRPNFTEGHEKLTSEINVSMKVDNIFNHVPQDELDKKVLGANLNTKNRVKRSYHSELVKCYAMIAPANSFGVRVNTIHGYCAANKKIFSIWDRISKDIPAISLISPLSTIKSTQMGENSVAVAENTTISEKTSIKTSVIGPNCMISPKTRVSDSYIMKNVTIEEGCVIENSILCEGVTVKTGSVLKSCFIGFNYVVPENTKKEKVHLSGSEIFMTID